MDNFYLQFQTSDVKDDCLQAHRPHHLSHSSQVMTKTTAFRPIVLLILPTVPNKRCQRRLPSGPSSSSSCPQFQTSDDKDDCLQAHRPHHLSRSSQVMSKTTAFRPIVLLILPTVPNKRCKRRLPSGPSSSSSFPQFPSDDKDDCLQAHRPHHLSRSSQVMTKTTAFRPIVLLILPTVPNKRC
ncbi:hypothetical protein DM01DRAFT_1334218, partial [Hesseltinella vesiculosa]